MLEGVETDECTAEVEEGQVDVDPTLVADR
jgi:hypothetical protein